MRFRLYEGRRIVPHTKKEMGILPTEVTDSESEFMPELNEETPTYRELEIRIILAHNDTDSSITDITSTCSFYDDVLWYRNRFENDTYSDGVCVAYKGKIQQDHHLNVSSIRAGAILFGNLGFLSWQSDVFMFNSGKVNVGRLYLKDENNNVQRTFLASDSSLDLNLIADASKDFMAEDLVQIVLNKFINVMQRSDPELLDGPDIVQ